MIIYYLIILIYISFVLDFLIWPIKSEGSTRSLLTRSNTTWLSSTMLLLVFAISLLFYLTPLLHTLQALYKSTPIENIPLSIIGLLVAVAGRWITLKGARVLRSSERNQLVGHSIFRFTRNPISLGMHLTIIGLIFVFPRWYLWLGLILYMVNLHIKIITEERFLQAKFKEHYTSYCKSVPRYLIS